MDVYSWHDGVYDSKEEEKHHNLTARPNTFKPATADPGNFTIWLVLWSQPISFNRRLVRCFNYVTPLWSAVDYYQHLSVRRKAWNTPSLVTDEIKGLIKNSSGCQWHLWHDKVYDSKDKEKHHNSMEAQQSQTNHCRTRQCHHLTCFIMSTNFIQQETS